MTKQGCSPRASGKSISVQKADVQKIVRALESIGVGKDIDEAKEYGYANLVLCVIDAVFSLQEHYSQVQRTVCNFVRYWDSNFAPPNAQSSELSLRLFASKAKTFTPQQLAAQVFIDTHKAPGCKSLLKAAVVVNLVDRLLNAGIETPADVMNPSKTATLKSAVFGTKGIKQAGYSYLRMLSGDEDEAKQDTWITQFSIDSLGRAVSGEEAVALLRAATEILKKDHPTLNLRAVDHFVWVHMSGGVSDFDC
ncbi:hypothetical protein ANRL3_02880 [Anaerolineae bacterium]|nr:hypothetical protein ANRL3_02880 [Anaerolineae bacterium]